MESRGDQEGKLTGLYSFGAADSNLSVEQREDAAKRRAEPLGGGELGTPPAPHLAWNVTHPLAHLARDYHIGLMGM